MSTWNGFRKIAVPVTPALPDSFPRKKEFDDRYDTEQAGHRDAFMGIIKKYFPEHEGPFTPDIVRSAPQMTQRNFGNEFARLQIKKKSDDERFDFDLSRALNQHQHSIEKEENRKSPAEIMEMIRAYQNKRYSLSPAVRLQRAIHNALFYQGNREQVLQKAKEKREQDPEFRSRQNDLARDRSRQVRSTNLGRVQNNVYVRENKRINHKDPLTENCPCKCGGIKKVHLDNFRHDFQKEWDSLKFSDDTQTAIENCNCGKCNNRPEVHMNNWYSDRVNPPRTAFKLFSRFRRF
jgi:hypothetical protein